MNFVQDRKTSEKILMQFKSSLSKFLDELIDLFPKEGNLVIASICIKNTLPIQEVMHNFILKVLPFQHMIKQRNEKFFLEHDASIFGSETSEHVNHFRDLWLELDVDDKLATWQWFDLLTNLASRYNLLHHIYNPKTGELIVKDDEHSATANT